MRKRAHNALPEGESAFNSLYGNYKRRSLRHSFELSKEQFKQLTKMNCHYCASPAITQYPTNKTMQYESNRKKYITPYYYNGIDRKDPNLGYTWDNSLPCCGDCNYAKSDLTYAQFLNLINKIYLNRIH